MTDRTGNPRRRKLLARRARFAPAHAARNPISSNPPTATSLIFTTQPPDSPKARALTTSRRRGRPTPVKRGHVDLHAVLRELGKRQMLNVLLEAGAELNGAALEAGIVDKMILFYAPKIMGTGGVPMARIPSKWFPKSPSLTNITDQSLRPGFLPSKDTFTMFTGITEHVGKIEAFDHDEKGGRLRISLEGAPAIAAEMKLGDSISVNGCCLTVVEFDSNSFRRRSLRRNSSPHRLRRKKIRPSRESRAPARRHCAPRRPFRPGSR